MTRHSKNQGLNPDHGELLLYELLLLILAQHKNVPHYQVEHRCWPACGAPSQVVTGEKTKIYPDSLIRHKSENFIQ